MADNIEFGSFVRVKREVLKWTPPTFSFTVFLVLFSKDVIFCCIINNMIIVHFNFSSIGCFHTRDGLSLFGCIRFQKRIPEKIYAKALLQISCSVIFGPRKSYMPSVHTSRYFISQRGLVAIVILIFRVHSLYSYSGICRGGFRNLFRRGCTTKEWRN